MSRASEAGAGHAEAAEDSKAGDSVHRLVRLVEPHDARLEAIRVYPFPSAEEKQEYAMDWIRSHAYDLASAAFPRLCGDHMDWRGIKHRMGLYVQREWETECVNKWAREMNATFDRHRNKWVIVNPPDVAERHGMVKPIAVTITREDGAIPRTTADYHRMVGDKIRAAGIPLGAMLWLEGVRGMAQDEIDREWLKELSKHDISKVDVEETPGLGTRILLWPNVSRQESMPGTCSAATEGNESK